MGWITGCSLLLPFGFWRQSLALSEEKVVREKKDKKNEGNGCKRKYVKKKRKYIYFTLHVCTV